MDPHGNPFLPLNTLSALNIFQACLIKSCKIEFLKGLRIEFFKNRTTQRTITARARNPVPNFIL